MEEPNNIISKLHSAPPALAWCDAAAAIAFRTDSWTQAMVVGSEHLELDHHGSGRVVALSQAGAHVELLLLVTPADGGYWLQLGAAPQASAELDQLRSKVAELEQQAFRDTLTGLWNRRFFDGTVASEMARAERHQQPLTLLFIDVDHFKTVNDTCGHAVGDAVLREVARVLTERCRSGDRVIRWGGDEFAVLATHCGCRAAAALAEDLRQKVASAAMPEGLQVTLSIGGAQFLVGETQAQWFERTDAQVYAAKESGRNAARMDMTGPAPSEAGVVELVFRDEYISGHAKIDEQHRKLFDLANHVLALGLRAEQNPKLHDDLMAALDRLLEHVVSHFADEEKVIAAAGYPHAAAHGRAHARLVERALALRTDVAEGRGHFGMLADFLAREVVVKHLAQTDTDFFAWIGPKAAG